MTEKLYRVFKYNSETPAAVTDVEVLARDNLSVRIKFKDGGVMSYSAGKIGTMYFETPEDAKVDFIRQQREYISRLEADLEMAKVALEEAKEL